MGKRLRVTSILLIGLLFIWGSSPYNAFCQSAGDVAFTGFNANDKSDFAIVVFEDISGGQQIHFTNEEWDGGSFSGSGGDFTWTAPAGGVTAGTVIIFNEVGDVPTATVGTISDDANMNLSGSGDVIYAFTGTDKNTADTFLAAIATHPDRYDGSEGSLTGTGLTQDDTAILLPDNTDVAEYFGPRGGNTPDGYIENLNNIINNWQHYNGSSTLQILPFSSENFVMVQPPTISFSQALTVGTEQTGTATIQVKLTEPPGSGSVSVDVVYLSSASNASITDISNYSTTNVQFDASDAEGTVKSVIINIGDDTNFEGGESAVFQLQNISAGAIIKPNTINLEIIDNDQPDVVINEIFADPPTDISGDANEDGTRDSGDDEFIEIVNNTTHDIDLSGWEIQVDGSTEHTFYEGTVLPANQAVVVFGGGEPQSAGDYITQTAKSGSLGLSNGGGTVTLVNQSGITIQEVDYGSAGEADAGDDQSITRDPDITGDSFVKHSTVADASGAIFSPGTQTDGTTFNPATTYATAIHGSEGWRMMASPTQSTSFSDLFTNLWMQGASGSDDPSGQGTLYSWDETIPTFSQIADMNTAMTAGKGYIVYVYADDEFSTPGIQGGFPKVISTSESENPGSVNVTVTATDDEGNGIIDGEEGWNLLGNPFGTDISVDAVLNALDDVDPSLNLIVYIWDHNTGSGNGGYEELQQGSNETIAPFQAFFIRYTHEVSSGSATFTRSNLAANQGTTFYDKVGVNNEQFVLYLGDGDKYDTYEVHFDEQGELGEGPRDAYKLFSLNPNSINLFSTVGQNTKLAINVLPPLNEMDRDLYIPLKYQLPHSGEYTFSWDKIDELPPQVTVYLIDHKTGRKIDLSEQQDYTFSYLTESNENNFQNDAEPAFNRTKDVAGEPRFEVEVAFAEVQAPGGNEMDKAVTLSPNYPNPFRGQTTIPFKLKEATSVTLTVWNIVGQKVATIADDDPYSAGEHNGDVIWNPPSNLPSGIYILKLEAAGKILIRKMTLIK